MEDSQEKLDGSKKTETGFESIAWRLALVAPLVYLVYLVATSGAPANVAGFINIPIISIGCGLVFSRTAIGFGVSLVLYLFVGVIFFILKGAMGLR